MLTYLIGYAYRGDDTLLGMGSMVIYSESPLRDLGELLCHKDEVEAHIYQTTGTQRIEYLNLLSFSKFEPEED